MIDATVAGVRLRGIASAVPDSVRTLEEDESRFGPEETRRVFKNTGIRTRHVSVNGMCASDLMVPATERLMGDLGWDPATVEALVVVTQGPDFALPATACILQERLGLADSVAAFPRR